MNTVKDLSFIKNFYKLVNMFYYLVIVSFPLYMLVQSAYLISDHSVLHYMLQGKFLTLDVEKNAIQKFSIEKSVEVILILSGTAVWMILQIFALKFLRNMLKPLTEKIHVAESIHKNMYNLGILGIFFIFARQFIYFITAYLIHINVAIQNVNLNFEFSNAMDLIFNPAYLIPILFLALSKILKFSYQLQQDNDLTI